MRAHDDQIGALFCCSSDDFVVWRTGLDDLKNTLWDLVTEARAADLVPEDEGIGDG